MRVVQKILRSLVPAVIKNWLYKLQRFISDNLRLSVEVLALIFRFRYSNKISEEEVTCHFLICNNTNYVSISKYAIFSYARFNPQSKITIHCDLKTYPLVRKKYRFFPKSKMTILKDISDVQYPYISKGLLLLSLQGTKDIFLDVDTRINERIPECLVPTALVAEFKFSQSEKFSRILDSIGCVDFAGKYLLNVTFVSWGGIHLYIDNKEFLDWSSRYMNLPWEDLLSKEAIPYFKRFVEQLFFSLIFQAGEWGVLKSQDRVGDKGIIESSYYGASGYRFGR